MYARDRLANLALFAASTLAWAALGAVVTTQRPGGVEIRLAVAGLFGLALTLTTVPLFWLAVFARHRRIAHRGDWLRAGRRGLLVGLPGALLVALRFEGALSVPLFLFVVVLVAFAELSLSVRR